MGRPACGTVTILTELTISVEEYSLRLCGSLQSTAASLFLRSDARPQNVLQHPVIQIPRIFTDKAISYNDNFSTSSALPSGVDATL